MKNVLLLWLTVLLLSAVASAHEPCSAELKLLLVPGELHTALVSLHARAPRLGQVYLYDTDLLSLLSHGILVRLRQGSSSDLTVKLRSPDDSTAAIQPPDETAKCEFDVVGGQAFRSLSITSKFSGPVPQTGKGLLPLLSPGQKRLTELKSIDWALVKKIGAIKSTTWRVAAPPNFPRLSLELWEWPGGSILELSARVPPADISGGYERLRRLATASKLTASPHQRTKTGLALESIAHTAPH